MTPEEIVAKLANSVEHFEPIDRQPSDTDFTGIRKVLDTLFIQILYDKTGSVHNPIRLIWLEAEFNTRYGLAFLEPTRVGAYDTGINNNDTAFVRAGTKAAHKAKRADRATYKTVR